MARLDTFVNDGNITIDDKLLGSSFEGMGAAGAIYQTKNFKIKDLLSFFSYNLYQDNIVYSLSDITGDISQNKQEITDLVNGLTDLRIELVDQIALDIQNLETQTNNSITLLDTTLSQAISDVSNTVTTEVSNLNDRILQGETDVAQDILNLQNTISTETANLTTLINTETGLISETVSNLDDSITLQLSGLSDDISGALQEALNAGSLATAAQASVDAEVIARSTAVGAVAGKVETIETQFTFSTEDGSIIGTSGALAETITTTASTAAGAVATRVDVLEAEYVLSTEDGSILGIAENSITNLALTTVTGAVATRVDTLETQFTITDGVVTGFSQSARDRIDTSISDATSAQFQSLDTIKTQFVFTDGNITAVSGVIQTSITDSISDATSAQFTKLDEVATQFVFDGNAISGVQGSISSTIDSAKLEAISTADTAAQNKVDTFAAKIVTTDANGNITGLSDAVQTSVSDVVAQDGYASSGQLNTLSSSVGLIPRIYRQNNAPSLTETPIGSLWFDTDNNNKSYILVSGTPNVWTTVQDQEFVAFKSSATEDIQTNADETSANATKLTNLNATLDILNPDGTVKKNTADFFADIRADVDANSATASKVDTLESTVGDANSGLVASVTTAQQAIADINGNLTATYGIEVDAGGNIASMKLYADENSSEIRFNADSFKIWNGTAAEAPFEVSGGVVKLKSAAIGTVTFGSLDGVPETFITTVIYADDISGTNPSTTKGTKNFVAFYNSSAAWVDGDPLPSGVEFTQMRGNDGVDGTNGLDGADGLPGADGTSTYFHVAYADDSSGNGFSQNAAGKLYIGTYVDTTQADAPAGSTLWNWQLVKGADGVDGSDGIPGVNGVDGQTSYLHIAYANKNASGQIIDFHVGDPTGREYLGTYTDFTLEDSNDPNDYTWVLVKGADGLNGLDGADGLPGADGTSSYFHVAYADDESGNGFSQTGAGKLYIGTYVDTTQADAPAGSSLWNWQLVKGADGVDGSDGIPGINGVDGQTSYLHVAYANKNASGEIIDFHVGDPTGRDYLGTYTDFVQSDSNDPSDYTWVLVKGADGINGIDGADGLPGPPGADGVSTYFHVAYADNASGGGFSQSGAGKLYIGTYVDTTEADAPAGSSLWNWQLVKGADGADGADGIPGINGVDGQTSYLHVAYANKNASGEIIDFNVSDPTGREYIGTYTDFVQADSNDSSDYTWVLFKGADGQDGADGYTPVKGVDYFDGLDGTNGVDGTDGSPGVDGDSANVVVTNATSAQCPNGGKVYEFYVGTTLIDTQIVCNGVDGVDGQDGTNGTNGTNGTDGDDGLRIVTGLLYYQSGSSTPPSTPSETGITYNFDNGTFSSMPTGWGLDTPEMAAGTASNKYWTSRYQVIESLPGSNSGTPSFFTPIQSFAFNQVVTFSSLGSSGTTVIDGSRITTGFIRSGNWDAPDAGETFADAGTAIYLNTGAIISKGFVIDDSGNAFFKGDITGASGTFSGSLNINGNFLVNTAGSVQIKGGDTLGNARFEILDDSGNSKYRLYGGGMNLNSWTGDNALSGGQIQFGGVAYMYSGNGTTVTSNHHMTLDVYGGSKKLFLKADQITLRKSTTTGGSHTTIIEGDLEVQGNVSFTSSSSHPDTSSVTDSNNTGYTFIQNLDFDTYGHVLSYTTGTVSFDTPAIYTDGSGNPQLTTGVTAAEVRGLIGAGTSSFSGDYVDLTNKPTLFDGDYNSLTNKPTLGTAAAEDSTAFASATHDHDSRYLRKDTNTSTNHTITAYDFQLSSDESLKENVKEIETSVPINFVEYNFIKEPSRKRYGVIAQELEKTNPELVSEDDNGKKSVAYTDLLIAKIAELEKRIKELEDGRS